MWSSCEVLLFGTSVCVVGIVLDTVHNHVDKHGCLSQDYLFRFLYDISLKNCVKECAIRPVCQAVNYQRHLRLCKLLSKYSGDDYHYAAACSVIQKQYVVERLPTECKQCFEGETCELDVNTDTWTCVIKECKPLNVTNGYILGNKNTIGSRIIYACNNGYKRSTEMTFSVCQADGNWSLGPKCIPDPMQLDFCPGVVLDDGKVYPTGTLNSTSVFDDGYDCNPSNVYCHANGTWETLPTCSKSVIALYMGCYLDCNNRLLEAVVETFDPSTTENCINQCVLQGYKFAFTEASNWCHCGNEVLHFTRADESDCSLQCRDNTQQICGGPWRASLYDLTIHSSGYGIINNVQKCAVNGSCIPPC